jgi:peptide/nickel transport system substrate-binding protein
MARRLRRRNSLGVHLLITVLVLTACGPSAREAAPPSSQSSQSSGAPAAQAAPRILNLGVQREPASFEPELIGAAASSAAGGGLQYRPIAMDDLTVPQPGGGSYEARLAQEMPSVEKGTWKLNSDGTMDLTWKLRPNITWHDGAPFTTADITFAYEVRQDPTLPRLRQGGTRPELMESVTAVDPLTFVVRWKQVYVRADEGAGIEPLAKHLLEESYRRDKEAMMASRYLSTEFVGLGAYKLVHWEPGSHMEFARHEGYYLGRPAFDRVFLKFIPDVNTLVANFLAGTLDVILPPTVDLDTGLELKRQFDQSGNGAQVRADIGGELHQAEIQHRAEFARPRNGLTVREVRQALYHAIDRKAFSEVTSQGLAPVADSWYAPNDPIRKEVERDIPQFPYDLNRAQQLLTQAGWVKGSDGILVHQTTGDRFETEIMHRPGTGFEREANVVADGWKSVGVQVSFNALTPQNLNDSTYLATRSSVYITSPTGRSLMDNRLHSSQTATAQTRWTGSNRGGYFNPKVDEILDKLAITIDFRERIPLHRQLLQEQMVDIGTMPIIWLTVPIIMAKGVTGPEYIINRATHYIWKWDRKD